MPEVAKRVLQGLRDNAWELHQYWLAHGDPAQAEMYQSYCVAYMTALIRIRKECT